jgi:hypothetical protein
MGSSSGIYGPLCLESRSFQDLRRYLRVQGRTLEIPASQAAGLWPDVRYSRRHGSQGIGPGRGVGQPAHNSSCIRVSRFVPCLKIVLTTDVASRRNGPPQGSGISRSWLSCCQSPTRFVLQLRGREPVGSFGRQRIGNEIKPALANRPPQQGRNLSQLSACPDGVRADDIPPWMATLSGAVPVRGRNRIAVPEVKSGAPAQQQQP